MEFLIEKVIDALLEATGIKEQVSRHESVIRWLKRFGLADVEALQRFEDVYAYAVVEFAFDQEGRRKPPELLRFFKAKDVQDLFQLAYGRNDPRLWLGKGEAIAESRLKGKVFGIDPKQELGEFTFLFLNVVKQTRSPFEIWLDQELDHSQHQIKPLLGRKVQEENVSPWPEVVLSYEGSPEFPAFEFYRDEFMASRDPELF